MLLLPAFSCSSFFQLNGVVLVSKLLFILLCDRNEHRCHVSNQEIICLWNRTFLFVFNHSQWDVCLILSLPITLLCACVGVHVYNGCPVFEHRAVHCYAVTIVWVEWDRHRSAWQPTIRLSLLTIVVGNLMKWWRGKERAGRQGESSITAEFHIDFHIEAFRKMDGAWLLNDWIKISLTRPAGQMISGCRMLNLYGKCLPPRFTLFMFPY